LEFVGKVDVITNEAGEQVTSFTDGILPIAMQMPCILMLDEADAVRGDIAYCLQPVLEGKSLRLLEDGGRMVEPHPEFCIMATANTVGAGDSTGMYSAAVKMQSKAAMNRYNIFIHVDYMKVSDEMDMIRKVVPDVHEKTIESLDKFVTAYRSAINIGEITAPISPRNTITIAQYTTDFHGRIGVTQAFKRALERNLFNSMDEGERAIAVGIADRVLA
jgi:cobaltochelatase CobS